jgi:sugar phosphate isomerase/epimerase
MKIGVCGGFDRIAIAAECGFDYIEANFKDLTVASEEKFYKFNEELVKCGIACEAANCFLPGEMKVTGNQVDYIALEKYLKAGFARASETGIKMVVMGSGGARSISEDCTYQKAVNQIIYFVHEFAGPIAAEHKIDFVFEPLRKAESNIINTIKEGAMLAAAVNLPNVGTLGDIFHMHIEGDTYDDIRDLKGIFRHAHISNPVSDHPEINRIFMKNPDEYDYKGFFDALKFIGCERVSIEAGTKNFAEDAREAIKIMNLYK